VSKGFLCPQFPAKEWAALSREQAIQKLVGPLSWGLEISAWPSPEDWQAQGLRIDEFARLNLRFMLERKPGQRARRRLPKGSLRSYESWIFESSAIPTRDQSLHDFFNALVWLNFPRAKYALHKKALALQLDWPLSPDYQLGRRSPLQDRLTCFDEGGVVFELRAEDKEEGIQALFQGHDDQLKEAFVRKRATDFTLFGHGILEALLKTRMGGERDPSLHVGCVLLRSGEESRDMRLSRYLQSFSEQTPNHGTLLVNWLIDSPRS
jgi:hypothetical protein